MKRTTFLIFTLIFLAPELFSQEKKPTIFEADYDILPLQNGWNWLSFPRLERYNDYPAATIPVLERINYFPLELEMHYMWPWQDWIKYENYEWTGNLLEIKSTMGYKLEFDVTEGPAPNIILHGARLHPATEITLSPSQENWIGYFVQKAQWPWDAFPEDLFDGQLTSITAQYWAMVKLDGKWIAPSYVQPIKYGDMVIVTISGNEPVSFAWNHTDEDTESEAAPETEYYSFTEQAEYLPIFIEKSPGDDYLELAVLANGEVKGAAVALETDTLVQVRAYLGDVPPGTPIEFETWSGTKSMRSGSGSYAVLNHKTGIFERRTVYKGENLPFQIVSLKPSPDAIILSALSDVSCAPNPFGTETFFSFRLNEESWVQLRIFDLHGNTLTKPLNSNLAAGYYRIAWDGTAENGHRLANGVYMFRITTSQGQKVSGKVVLIN